MPDEKQKVEDAVAEPDSGMRTVVEQARQVTTADDVQVSREQDHHEKDIESRDMQLWLAKVVILGCMGLGGASLVLGIITQQQTAIQTGLSLLSTILGVVLGFMFKR